MSSIYYTVEGIGVTASSIAPFVNPEKVIECIKKLYPSDLENIENDEIIIDTVLLVCDMTREQVENLINDDIYFCHVLLSETYCG